MKEKTFVDFGILAIDCSSMASFLVDLPVGGRLGLQSELPGFDLAVSEIMANQAELGAKAGVTELDVQVLKDASDKIARIDEHLPAVRKLLELLEETRAVLDDQRSRQVSAIASAVENRTKVHRDGALLAKYENARAYRSYVGRKAARTRRRNQVAETENPVVETESTEAEA